MKDRALEDADARLGAMPPIGAAAAGDGAAASMTVPMAAAKPRRSVLKITDVSLALAADRHRALNRACRWILVSGRPSCPGARRLRVLGLARSQLLRAI